MLLAERINRRRRRGGRNKERRRRGGFQGPVTQSKKEKESYRLLRGKSPEAKTRQDNLR